MFRALSDRFQTKFEAMAAERGYGGGGGSDYVESIYNLIPKIEEKPPKPQMCVLLLDSIEAMV